MENRIVYEFNVSGEKKYIIEHLFDKMGRGNHFHGADASKGSPFNKRRYNQYEGHFPEDFDVLITMDDFLDVEETLLLQSDILDKLDEMDRNNTSIIYQGNEQDAMSAFKELLIKTVKNYEKYVFFVKGATKIGGLILKGKTVSENINLLLRSQRFFIMDVAYFFLY